MVGKSGIERRRRDLIELFVSLKTSDRSRQFVSTREAAEWCCLSRRTIIDWIDSGHVDAVRLGKKYFVHLDSLRQRVSGGQ